MITPNRRLHHLFLGAIFLLAFAGEATLAQTPTPTPTPSATPGLPGTTNTYVGVGNRILASIDLIGGTNFCTGVGSNINALATKSIEVVAESMWWARLSANPLQLEAMAIAEVLLWVVLFAEITFAGFRLMLGSSIVEQLGLLTTKTFIYLIVSGGVVFPGANSPYNSAEGIIRGTMFRLMHAGKVVGADIVTSASHTKVRAIPGIAAINVPASIIPGKNGNGFSSLSNGDKTVWGPATNAISTSAGRGEPIMYWLAWLGVEHVCKYGYDSYGVPYVQPNNVVTPANEYKYAAASLNARIWGENPDVRNSGNASQRIVNAVSNSIGSLRQLNQGTATGSGTTGGVTDFATGMLTAMMPLQMFGIAMSVAGVQIGSLVTILFAQMSVLVGSITAFNIASALGLAVLPLMYFRMFDKVWSQYLIGLASLGLIPCFFYILSAIGFVFSTTVFEMLFPLDGNPQTKSLAQILNDVFFSAVRSTMVSFSIVTNVFTGLFEIAIGWLLVIYLALGRILFGSTVVAAFITGGALFALLAPRFAFRWTAGFGAEDVVEKISEAFNGIQSAVGSGMGQMYSDALSRAGSLGSGFARGIKP